MHDDLPSMATVSPSGSSWNISTSLRSQSFSALSCWRSRMRQAPSLGACSSALTRKDPAATTARRPEVVERWRRIGINTSFRWFFVMIGMLPLAGLDPRQPTFDSTISPMTNRIQLANPVAGVQSEHLKSTRVWTGWVRVGEQRSPGAAGSVSEGGLDFWIHDGLDAARSHQRPLPLTHVKLEIT